MSFQQLFEQTKISTLLAGRPHQEMITLDHKSTISQTLKVLAKNEILSVPVCDPNFPVNVKGFVDYLDICSHLLSLLPTDVSKLTKDDLVKVSNDFFSPAVETILNKSGADFFAPVVDDETTAHIMELYEQGIHRVALVDDAGKITNIVSQSDLIRFIHNHKDYLFKEASEKSMKDLGLVSGSVISVRRDQSTIEALSLLVKHKLSAVAVIDNEGKLIECFSAADIRILNEEEYSSLLLTPVHEFLYKRHKKFAQVYCAPYDKFERIISLIAATKDHRVWVVDELDHPVSVVTLTDINKVLRSFP